MLSISGEDHPAFLQGQGTADLRGSGPLCRYNLWLDHTGKIIGDSFVLKRDLTSMLLVSDATPASLLIDKFDRHIIADDVEIEDLTDQYELYSIEPECAAAALSAMDCDAPQSGQFLTRGNAILFTGRRLGQGTLQILAKEDLPFTGDFVPIDDSECEAIRIAAGMPLLPVDSDQHALNPIEASIISPISFTKGCYLGQEVVARVERLGRVRRRLARFRADPGVAPGDWCLHQGGQQVGKLTSVANYGDNALAIGWVKSVIQDEYVVFDEGGFHIESLPGS